MSYIEICDSEFGFFDPDGMAKKGLDLHAAYAGAQPFPHVMIDDFCSTDVLNRCLDFFPTTTESASSNFNREQERLKTSFNPDQLPASLRSFFYSLNSRPFIRFLENLSGIKGLIPDPYYFGGGFHQTSQGGHLSIHADFNHHRVLGLERRLNVLIYLNHDWKEEYGGALELWDANMNSCVQRINPVFNRCVVFSTTGESFHGHPVPVAHPDNTPRRSIALYYYTATWDSTSSHRTTQFRKRPGSEDKVDWEVKIRQTAQDFLPPILMRGFDRLGRRLR